MASTATKPLGESSSGATTFSYAQAAKGRGASATTPTVQSSQATSGANTPSKESNFFTDTPSGSVNGTVVPDIDRTAKTNGDSTTRVVSTGPEAETKAGTLPSSPSFGTASTATLPKEDMSSSTPNLSTDSPWDRPHQNGTSNEKAAEGAERKKGKKGRKDKNADKDSEVEKEEVKPAVLVAAPPPTVNIWQQRREAQAAMAKVSPQISDVPQFPDAGTNSAAVTSGTKPSESKKKGKPGSEEQEKPNSVAQSAGGKDNQITKGQKKGEGNSRSKEDSNGKRAPRGARAAEKDEKSLASQLPPPVEDSISWPTPETALEEEKRKAQEKVEKEDKEEGAPNKPRPKDKWVTVPYVPSVAFNTPLPTRGGRGGRGGGRGSGRDGNARSSHAPNGSISGDKPFTGVSNTNEARERGRDNSNNNNRAASLPPNSSKRSSGEDQRKASVATFEKSKQESSGPSTKGDHNIARDNRRSSIAPQSDVVSANQTSNQLQAGTGKTDGPNGLSIDLQALSRAGGPDRKADPNGRNDYPKDANGHGSNRERSDGRTERGGRGGGFRGRGGHNNFPNGQQPHPQNLFTNGHVAQPPNGYGVRQNSGPYSPPIQQQYGNPYSTNAGIRGNRNSLPPLRSQSIPNGNNMYSRYSPNIGSGSQQMPPLQTSGPVFDYSNVGSMSAVPYNPYVEQWSILSMVTMQLEYYFSIDNLCKDVFLRKHMDSQGFVVLSFIANFKRIQTLTMDYQLVRWACQESEIIDIIQGEDGVERVRRHDGWDKWTLPVNERDPIAQHEGPLQHFALPPPSRGPPSMMPGMMPQSQAPMSAPAFSPNGTESTFQPFPAASMDTAGIANAMFQQTESPMSAAVPDFAPRLQSNGVADPEFDALQAETTFTDEQIDALQLVWKDSETEESKPAVPFQGSSSRTFSNGSIDVRSIAEELLGLDKPRQGRTVANGTTPSSEMSPDGLRRSMSPYTSLSPTRPTFGNAPPVMWAKNQMQQVPILESNDRTPYSVVRERALKRRASSAAGATHPDMKILYDFWSHFLIRNFNPRMYLEFRELAFDDAMHRQDTTGVNRLVVFYDEILNSKKKTIPEVFAVHYVDLVKSEDPTKERPGFTKLRLAWRNGALDMKSRKKIDNAVDPKLREELER